MDALDLGVNLFVTLFALLDPLGNIPIFAAATAGATLRQRVSVSALICLFAAVFLAFAPGGLAEMGLIALSLQMSVVYVTAHHVLRIVLSVLIAQFLSRRLRD